MPNSLYHYTDINAVRGLLEHKKLWLTGHEFLNDKHEFIDGYHMLQQDIEQHLVNINANSTQRAQVGVILQYLNDTLALSCSFSKSPDMLSQWRSYCPQEGGYCIEFDDDILRSSVINPGIQPVRTFEECIYDQSEKARQSQLHAEYCINGLFQNHSSNADRIYQTYLSFLHFCLRCKNEHFLEEQEVRLCTYSNSNRHNTNIVQVGSGGTTQTTPIFVNDPLSFRTSKNLLIPYLELPFDIRAIKSITIGPNKNMDTALQGLELYLREQRLAGQIIVNKSKIPYRNW